VLTLTAADVALVLRFGAATPAGRGRILQEVDADESGRAAAVLLRGLLDIYGAAARRLRTDTGWVALLAALAEIERVDQDLNHRAAAGLIASYGSAADIPGVDADLRDLGIGAFNAEVDRISEVDCFPQVVTAIVAVWQRLLPELTTEAGRLLLRHIAFEIIESD
jgi:hypothetical protein